MPYINQVEGFRLNTTFWRILGVWPKNIATKYYKYYMTFFVLTFCILYDVLATLNFFYMPKQLDNYIGEMIFYFTELSVASKVLTYYFKHYEIEEIFDVLECTYFQPETDEECVIIKKAKKFNKTYYNVTVTVSLISHLTHIFTPLIFHIFLSSPLELPMCSYSFIPDDVKTKFIYPLYLYQLIGIHSHVWYNINIDTFFLGIMILTIAQLDILDGRLRNLTNDISKDFNDKVKIEKHLVHKLNKSIKHFDEIGKFCKLIERAFSVTLFVQTSVASAIICICVFRFTLPAPVSYLVFLSTYMFVMTIQVCVPCWFGTRIINKSDYLTRAIYDCDWTTRSREFKSNMRVFLERATRPLTIVGWKLCPLSLTTFTSIMNTAYSFFTLLRHMQSRQ